MKAKLSSSNNVAIVAMLVIAVLVIGFWMLLLSPKREEADKLSAKANGLRSSLAIHQSEVDQAVQAKAGFSKSYEQLVVLGKAVPGDDDTASLMVQLNRIARNAGISFRKVELKSAAGEVAPLPTEASTGTESGATPTEAAASTLPLGATIGSAGLGVMPYELVFYGEFFQLADFISGLDSLVQTQNANVSVDGRLFTIDGFSLKGLNGRGFPALEATFSITTYLTPPEQGVTAGATTEGPEAAPVAATIGAAP
jgi:Tfp pilus assembly protein PilO